MSWATSSRTRLSTSSSEAFLSGKIVQTSENKLQAGLPVDTHAIPVTVGERVIAVVEQHTNELGVRAPSSLEKAYLEAAAELARMITVGAFPIPSDSRTWRSAPGSVTDSSVLIRPESHVRQSERAECLSPTGAAGRSRR